MDMNISQMSFGKKHLFDAIRSYDSLPRLAGLKDHESGSSAFQEKLSEGFRYAEQALPALNDLNPHATKITINCMIMF